MRHVVAVLVVAVGVVLAAAQDVRAQPAACTALGQATFVRNRMQEIYLWYRQLPDLDPAGYDTPEAYLDAVRVRPEDERFSYIESRVASDAFYSESQFVGMGFSSSVRDGHLRILQVFDGSPASDAGLDRGSRLDQINGRAVTAILAEGTLDEAFGPSEIGFPVTLAFTTRDGEARQATLRKRAVTIPTVSLTRVFEVNGARVGYVFFRNFVEPSVAALDTAFQSLRDAGVTELVLDLRYNGGGLVNVAVHLASLMAGTVARDQVFAESRHNDRNRRLNTTHRFDAPVQALGLSRVIVIATRSSASASELVINGLTPFLPVIVVGDRTYGKPVGQYAFPFCDKVLAPVSFSMVNARGQGDYFDGLPVDCPAPDDITRALGDPVEASLAVALGYVATGSCAGAPATALGREGARERPRLTGWRSVLNAQ
jgi:carboxyl-terminal processing protease